MSAGTATASSAPPGPVAAGPMLRLTRGEGTFGGTWQGEGSRLGTWTMGVRVYGCNLQCGLLQGSWSARTAAIPPTPGTSRTIHSRSGPTRPPSTRSWRSWNGACSHGCGAAARGWCSSPAANPSSRGRRWASSCGPAGSGDGASRSRPMAPCRRGGWAGPTAGQTTSTSHPSWRLASTGAPIRRPSGSAPMRSPNSWLRAGRSGSSSLSSRGPGRDRLVDRTVRVADRQRLGHAGGHQHRRPDCPHTQQLADAVLAA